MSVRTMIEAAGKGDLATLRKLLDPTTSGMSPDIADKVGSPLVVVRDRQHKPFFVCLNLVLSLCWLPGLEHCRPLVRWLHVEA